MVKAGLDRMAVAVLSVLMTLSFGACGKGGAQRDHFAASIDLPPPVEVGIVNPQGKFLWLLSPLISCPGITYEAGEVHVELRGLSGVEFDEEGVASSHPVFVIGGAYKLMVSDNLETELDNSFSRIFHLTISKEDISRLVGGAAKRSCKVL